MSNGRSTSCVVGDYGPAAWTGRIIDLDSSVFSRLATLGAGIIDVEVTW